MKILVIRFKHIGDVLLSSTICSSLRASFPDAEIDFLVYSAAAPLFEKHPAIDNVISLSPQETQSPIRYLRKIWSVSRRRYDLVIDATSTAKTELISLFCRSAKIRIGRYKKGRGFAYTHKVQKFDGDKIEQRLAMLQPLSDEGFSLTLVDKIDIALSNEERAQAKEKLVLAGVDFQRPLYAFSVSSKLNYRIWRQEYMQEVAEYCLDELGAQIVLLPGMAHEAAIVQKFADGLNRQNDVFADVAARSLRALAALLSHCDLYVGNEGGPRHFAEAVGTSTVCVFSPSADRAEWLKDGRDNHRAVEWRDVFEPAELAEKEREYEFGDERYYKLYTAIKPHHLIDLIDQVLAKQAK